MIAHNMYKRSSIRCVSPGNLAATLANNEEFLSTLESCTEPGHPQEHHEKSYCHRKESKI